MGCDVSKGYADFTILDSKEKVIERTFQLDDTFEGHNALYDFLSRFFSAIRKLRSTSASKALVGMKTTGTACLCASERSLISIPRLIRKSACARGRRDSTATLRISDVCNNMIKRRRYPGGRTKRGRKTGKQRSLKRTVFSNARSSALSRKRKIICARRRR